MATKKATKKAASVSSEPKETREEAFGRLANKRVNKALNDIRLIGNLGSYPHSAEQAEKIVAALQESVDALSIKMLPRTAAGKPQFSL